MTVPHPHTRSGGAATRACLAGEDLDWLGGRSVCVALDLRTEVTVTQDSQTGSHEDWAAQVWSYLGSQITLSAPAPPEISVTSQAPLASGLSSSSSLIIAIMRCFAEREGLRDAPILQWSYDFEFKTVNGGGMDQTCIVNGGAVLTQGRPAGLPHVKAQMLYPVDWKLVVLDSYTKKSTARHITMLRRRLAENDRKLAEYLRLADVAAGDVWDSLRATNIDGVRDGMDRAHKYMRDLQGMSTGRIEQLKSWADKRTGLVFKLTGAGGGGSLVAVCREADLQRIQDASGEAASLGAQLRVTDSATK